MLRPLAIGALACALACPALAQQPLSAGDKSVANFAFATQLGSGIYTIDGRTIQIYRMPLSFTLRPEAEKRWGMRITFPMTIGFYDFKPMDVADTGIPDSLDTVSLVPGLEFRIPSGKRLLLKPFFEGGVAREGATDTNVWVFSAGLRTFAGFQSGNFDIDLGNALLWSKVDPDGSELDDAFALFSAAAQARHLMGWDLWNRDMEWGVYGSAELYFDEPDFPLPDDGDLKVNDQYEVGATIGPREAWKIWKIKLPKLGIGYRFGSDASVVRFVIGTPIPVLKR